MRIAQAAESEIIIVSGASAVPAWLQIVVAISTPATAIFGAFAAFAAVRAANAARTQAKKSTEAANRSLEALGRAVAPQDLGVHAWLGRAPIGDIVAIPSPTLLRVQVFNPAGPPGIVSVSITTPGGATRSLTPTRKIVVADERAWFQLDDFVCGTAGMPFDPTKPHGEPQATVEHLITLDYADTRELLRWRQVFRVDEVLVRNNRQEGHTSYQDVVEWRVCKQARPEEPELVDPQE